MNSNEYQYTLWCPFFTWRCWRIDLNMGRYFLTLQAIIGDEISRTSFFHENRGAVEHSVHITGNCSFILFSTLYIATLFVSCVLTEHPKTTSLLKTISHIFFTSEITLRWCRWSLCFQKNTVLIRFCVPLSTVVLDLESNN